jgi:AcrR family transcriptional regulator
MSTSDKITESALKLFYRQGFHATGVEQLSKVAGVTKKTLYNYFSSKELLIQSALELRDKQFIIKMHKSVEAKGNDLRPLAYIEFIVQWVQETGFNGCAFINASAEYGNQQDQPHVVANSHKQTIISYLESICFNAEIDQPSLVARQLFLVGEGLIVASQVCGVQPDMIDAARKSALALIPSASM